MPVVSDEFVEKLAPIYRDILAAFPSIEPVRRKGDGLAIQTLHAALKDRYSLGEIREACENMANNGVFVMRFSIFAVPTDLGEELILRITGKEPGLHRVPPFPPLTL